MNREILFRGQIRKSGEKVNMMGEKLPGKWVYGGIFPGTGDHSIIYGWGHTGDGLEKFPVYSDTVGQYTGLTDKAKVKVFEGDIVKVYDEKLKKYFYGEVGFDCGSFCIFDLYDDTVYFNWMDYEVEIIGNKHDVLKRWEDKLKHE